MDNQDLNNVFHDVLKKQKKNKIKCFVNDIMDNISWYIVDKPRYFYNALRHWWWVCAKNKCYWSNLNFSIFNYYPWDFTYMFQSQLNWLNYSIKYYETIGKKTKENVEFVLQKQRLAKNLLEIVMEKKELYQMVEEPITEKNKNLYYYQRLKHICIPYVNLKNKNRFKYLTSDFKFTTYMYDTFQEELYKTKALSLYLKIIQTYYSSWWN